MPEAFGKRHSFSVFSTSLRTNFAWTFAGNAIYAAGQWAILSLFAKLGGAGMLGEYALALAVTAPLVMLSHLNLRAVLATDVGGRHPFGDYLVVRYASSAVAGVAIVAVALAMGGSWERMVAILAVGAAQSAETLSDAYLGAMQRRDRMDLVGRAMMIRTVVSLAALALALWATRDLVWAAVALAAGRAAVLLGHDRPFGAEGEDLARSDGAAQRAIFRAALPLGMVLMLVSLTTNLPRYAVERFLGASELGVFAAVVSFITIGGTVVNALGQSATPRLAIYYQEKDARRFVRMAAGNALLMLALGAAGVAVAWLMGSFVLRLLYRPEFAAYDGLLVAAMGAGTLNYVAISMGYAVTGARVFDAQLPLFALSAAVCGGGSWLLVPGMGLEGAVLALALAGAVQVAGQFAILGWAVRRLETAR